METTPLLDKQHDMLQALEECGPGWHSRTDLAAYLSKNKLNPAEIIALDMLAATGKLEKALRRGAQLHVSRWMYRIAEGGDVSR